MERVVRAVGDEQRLETIGFRKCCLAFDVTGYQSDSTSFAIESRVVVNQKQGKMLYFEPFIAAFRTVKF